MNRRFTKKSKKNRSCFRNLTKFKRNLKKIRETLIANALNQNPPSDFGSEDDIEDERDIEFFARCEKINYNKKTNKFIIIEDSEEIDDYLISESNETDYFSESSA